MTLSIDRVYNCTFILGGLRHDPRKLGVFFWTARSSSESLPPWLGLVVSLSPSGSPARSTNRTGASQQPRVPEYSVSRGLSTPREGTPPPSRPAATASTALRQLTRSTPRRKHDRLRRRRRTPGQEPPPPIRPPRVGSCRSDPKRSLYGRRMSRVEISSFSRLLWWCRTTRCTCRASRRPTTPSSSTTSSTAPSTSSTSEVAKRLLHRGADLGCLVFLARYRWLGVLLVCVRPHSVVIWRPWLLTFLLFFRANIVSFYSEVNSKLN